MMLKRMSRELIENCIWHGISADGLRAYASLVPPCVHRVEVEINADGFSAYGITTLLGTRPHVYSRKTLADDFICMGSTCNDGDHERWINGEEVELLC